ncbi:MAG: sugar ABC transporter substrate-binding protein [Marinosulfonomonas sp.]|nr:sugar ABC transporter substrate-binding protein [Marinosulfonomonas sp.]
MFSEVKSKLPSIRQAVGGVALGAMIATSATMAMAQSQPTIKIAINQSPWLDSFIAMVDKYEDETGNKIELDVTPFGGLLEKIRNSVRGASGTFDIVNVNSLWLSELYSGGFLAPLGDLRDGYALQDGVLDYGSTVSWNADAGTFTADGTLMGVPLNGNVQVLYYNTDVYEKLGLKEPNNWDELAANAKAIQADGASYGFVTRSGRSSIVYNFTPYLFSHGGSFFDIEADGSLAVKINSAQGKAALETYLTLAQSGPPSPGATEQGELIQLISTGRGAQAIAVIGAWGGLENPEKSAVVGKINAALIPAGPTGGQATSAGHWVGGVPKNISAERQEAAMTFLDWFQSKEVQVAYVQAGGVPVRGDLGNSSLAGDERYRFIDAYSANAANAVMGLPVAQAAEISDTVALNLNRAVIGELSVSEALNSAADGIETIMKREGYTVTRGPNL